MVVDDPGAQAAWRALQATAVENEELRGLLGQLALSPEAGETALQQWLSKVAGRAEMPVELATYVSGGRVERLVNIARAQTVNLVERSMPTSLYGLPAAPADFTGREKDIGGPPSCWQANRAVDQPSRSPR